MLNIIKSIRYSMRRDYLAWAYAVAVLAIYVFTVVLSITGVEEYTGAYGFRAIVETNEIVVFVVTILFVPLICSLGYSGYP